MFIGKPTKGNTMSKSYRSFIGLCGVLGVFVTAGELVAQSIPLQGIPASDSLGAEDIWGNPTFVGGWSTVDQLPTASGETVFRRWIAPTIGCS